MTQSGTSEEHTVVESEDLRATLAAAGTEERERLLREALRAQTAGVLEQPDIGEDSNFLEHGLTSLKALELTRGITSLTGIEIPLVAVIENPTPGQLARYASEAFAPESGANADSA
ncbi:hypothetical protein GCM10009801_73450 [Streptomyces albiaxialis]|uniref:Carrier domain-containing protein n=1 Tax=Streptomyces albiaxialis TaxID=329523 RepID=A0ABN2X047_9ACTN